MTQSTDKVRIARREYTCACCKRKIHKGSKYMLVSFKKVRDYLCIREDCGEEHASTS